MMRLYKRGSIYWVSACFEGQQERRSLNTRDKQVAQQLMRQMELDILSGGRLREIRWPEFEEEFLQAMEGQVRASTLRGYGYVVKRFGQFLAVNGPLSLRDMTPPVITQFCAVRRTDQHPDWKRPKTEGGMRFDLRTLHRALSYAVECGYIAKNPVIVRNLASKPRGTLPFSQDDIAKMLKHAEHWPQLQAIVLTFLHTGLRIGDVISLRKSDIEGDFLVVTTWKRDKVVRLKIHEDLRAALEAHTRAQNPWQRKSLLLFSTDTGRPVVSLDKILRRLWKRCEIVGGHAHRFRNTFAVGLLAQGASLYDVAKLLGNTAAVVEKYYAPFVLELQERCTRLVLSLDYVGGPFRPRLVKTLGDVDPQKSELAK
jgi:integrase